MSLSVVCGQIDFEGVSLSYECEYEPAEPREVNDNDGGYPGHPPCANVIGVWLASDSKKSNLVVVISDEVICKIEDAVIEGEEQNVF